jgi:glycosyltransferase involved in cell wall biosynthesis
VVDGGSTDGTRAIVERYPTTLFISEPDCGQADAINKGMRLAKGDILAWLNSDDYYLPLAFARAVAAMGDVALPRFVYGGCFLLYKGRILRSSPARIRLTRWN